MILFLFWAALAAASGSKQKKPRDRTSAREEDALKVRSSGFAREAHLGNLSRAPLLSYLQSARPRRMVNCPPLILLQSSMKVPNCLIFDQMAGAGSKI